MRGPEIVGFYFLVLILSSVGLVVLGRKINDNWLGIIIDFRNKVSLSEFQIVLWTVLLLSAYLVIVISRVLAGSPEPLAVSWDANLWWLMGINVTSTVTSVGIKNVKLDKKVKEGCMAPCEEPVKGVLVVNESQGSASLLDMFRGEEPQNYKFVDIGKVQMFFFTMIAAFAYFIAVLQDMYSASPQNLISSLPALGEGLVYIIGISHAGYLGSKWIDKQPTTRD